MSYSSSLRPKKVESLKNQDQTAPPDSRTIADSRRWARFRIDADIRIYSRTCGLLKGRTVDISESGIGAMLTLEAPLGEIVELNFTIPSGPLTILATVRQRNAFRYGFEFVDSDSERELIRRTCRDLAVEQSASAL